MEKSPLQKLKQFAAKQKAEDGEKKIERFLFKAVKALGGFAFKWTSSVRGVPDRIVLMPGAKVHFVELKSTGKNPKAIQTFMHALLRNLGFPVWVLDTKEKIDEFLKLIENDKSR